MRPRDAVALAIFWLLLALASFWGVLAPFDGRLFDVAVRLLPSEPPTAVAVVRAEGPLPPAQADLLRRAGAKRVVDLAAADVEGLQRAADFEPANARQCRPPAVDGVIRVLRLHDAQGRPCPLARLAAQAGMEVPDVALLSPDFAARTSTSIPRLDAGTLPTGANLGAAVAGRIVLRVPGPDIPSHVTPLYAADGLLEPSTPYAMALDAMARGRAIRWARPGFDVLIAALVALVLHLALRSTSYRVTLTVSLLAAVPVLLGLGATLHAGRLHIPATASLVAIAGFALRAILRRNRALGETLIDVDHRLTGLVGQPLGQGFEVATDLVWEQANRFVTEFFDLRRSLMLELPPGSTHMRPAAAFGCTAADIIEMRRDYRRAPFSTALAREHPTPPSRPFLPAEEGVVDLITPLMAADQLVGFWAFSVIPGADGSLDGLSAEAARYAREVAKLVLRGGTLDQPEERATGRWPTLARLRARLLDGANQAREQLAAYRDVFAAVGHPIAVCDLFGRVQMANPAFEEFAENVGQPLMAMSLMGMLQEQGALSPAAAKATMRQVVLGYGAEARVPLEAMARDLPQVLVLRPILRRVADPVGHVPSPFDLLGLIVEILPDVRDAEAARRLGQAATQYAVRSQSTLDAMSRTLDGLATDEGSQERLADIVAGALHDARHLLRQAKAPPAAERTAPHRVDPRRLFERARQAHARVARAKSVVMGMPANSAPPVAAGEESLLRLLNSLVGLLVDDAAPGSTVEAAWVTPDASTVQLRIANEGYGVPAWHLQDVMRDGAKLPPASASPLEQVAHAASVLDGGVGFQLETELGKGYRALLTLPRAL